MKKAGPILILFVILVLPLLIWIVLRQGTHEMQKLTYLGPMVENPDTSPDSVLHTIGNFSFINQDGEVVNEDSLEGNIVIFNLFQTAGTTISPKLARSGYKLQDKFAEFPNVRLISISVDPNDSVPLLKAFARKYEAQSGKWHMLFGNKDEVYQFARDELYMKAYQGDGGERGVVYSPEYRLVDREGKLRGSWNYDGTDVKTIDTLVTHVKLLEVEEAYRKQK